MIIIEDKNIITRVYIPKHFNSIKSLFKVKLLSLSTNKEYQFNVIDESLDCFYYCFAMSFQNCDEGEYKVVVYDDNKILSTTLMRIGDISENNKHYENENTIKYYE